MTHATVNAWLSQSHGKSLNPDKSYGLQCKDTLDDYGSFIFGKPWQECVGGADAKNVPYVAPAEYWTWTANDFNKPHQIPSRGDAIVWGGNDKNPYGHVAIVLSADLEGVRVLQQDGGAEPKIWQKNADGSEGYYSMRPVHEYGLYYDNEYTGPVTGWLSPREDKIIDIPVPVINKDEVMAKTYKHETKWTTKNQAAPEFYGAQYKGRNPTGVTIHHWGNDGQNFDNVAHFLATNNSPTSAHYVVEDGRIATLASPLVATYHAGHPVGNATTLGIEMRPECTPGDVDTLVQLIFELEEAYGSLEIYMHKDWYNTACPGRYEAKIPEIIERVNAMHNNGGRDPKLSSAGEAERKVEPQSNDTEVIKKKEQSMSEVNPNGYAVWSYRNPSIEDKDAYAILRNIEDKVEEILKRLEEK